MILRPLVRTIARHKRPLYVQHVPFKAYYASQATATAVKGKAILADSTPTDISKELESEGTRVLRVVRHKMAERTRLLQEMVRELLVMLE